MAEKLPGFAEAANPEKQYLGHRDRLKKRFAEKGSNSLQDYELLELLLFRSIPRRDTKPIAKKLLAEFGTIAEAVSAPQTRLSEIKGLGPSTITDFKLIKAIAAELVAGDVRAKPLLESWSSVLAYCRTAMAFEEIEQFKILFLDKKNRLIKDETQQTGTVDHTPVYPREVLKRALELSASSIILVHNHPSGDPTPSNADIQMTKNIAKIIEPVGITLHDHIIIARDGHASLRGLRLI